MADTYYKLIATELTPHVREPSAHTLKLFGLVRSGGLRVAIDGDELEGVESAVEATEYLYSGQSRGEIAVRL